MTTREVQIELQDYAASAWQLTWGEITTPCRERGTVARRAALCIAYRRFCGATLQSTAEVFKVSHCSVVYYEKIWPYDADIRALVQELLNHLNKQFLDNHLTNEIMFRATITGNLGRDAEIKNTNNGTFLSYSVAVQDRKDSDTTWVRVMQYAKSPEGLLKVLRKGASVVCEGRLQVGIYNGKPDVTLWADAVDITKYAEQPQQQERDAEPERGFAFDDMPEF